MGSIATLGASFFFNRSVVGTLCGTVSKILNGIVTIPSYALKSDKVGKCCICLDEESVITHVCNLLNDDNCDTHIYCHRCAIKQHAHGCAVCRVGRIVPHASGFMGILIRVCTWLLENTAGRMSRVLAWINRLTHSKVLVMTDLLTVVSGYVNLILNFNNPVALAAHSASLVSAAGNLVFNMDATGEVMMEFLGNYHRFSTWLKGPQLVKRENSKWDDSIFSSVEDHYRDVQLNEEGWKEMLEIHNVEASKCPHQLLTRENIPKLMFLAAPGRVVWILPDDDGNVINIPFHACQHQCVLLQDFGGQLFCEAYLEEFREQIISNRSHYFNCSENIRDNALQKIPPFVRPKYSSIKLPSYGERRKWWQHVGDAYSQHKTFLLAIGGIITTIGSAYGMYRAFAPQEIPPLVQNFDQYDEDTVKHIKRVFRPLKQKFVLDGHKSLTSGGGYFQSEALDDVVIQRIMRNYVNIRIYKDGNVVKHMTAIGIRNHSALLPRHYYEPMKMAAQNGHRITLAPAWVQNGDHNHEEHDYTFDKVDFKISPVTDLCVMRMPASTPMFKDIRKFIAKRSDMEGYINSEGKIFLAPSRVNVHAKIRDIQIYGVETSAVISDYDGKQFEAYDVLHYGYSQNGACGSLVLVNNSQRPIAAMHCAGSGDGTRGNGYGVTLTQEALANIFTEKMITQFEDVEFGPMEDANFIMGGEVQVSYEGSIPKEQQLHIPKKTKIVPSLIQGMDDFKPHSAPVFLSGDAPNYPHLVSPLMAGSAKHGKKTLDFPTTWITRAKNALYEGWIANMVPIIAKPKKLTYKEAVLGLPDKLYYDPMKVDTSSGWPWALGKDGVKTKTVGDQVLTSNTKAFWLNPVRSSDGRLIDCTFDRALLEEIIRKERLRQDGIVPTTVFVDTLKDERKKIEKLDKLGSTRVFCASPIDYTLAMRQSFLHFSAAFMNARFSVMSAVGINVHDQQWSDLVNRLSRVSMNNIVTLDYSNFGPGFNAKVAEAAGEIMTRWTLENVDGVNKLEMDALIKECTQSLHLCGNTLYRQTCGSPSGAAMTVIINSIVNLLYVLIAWDQLCGPTIRLKSVNTYDVFRKNIELFVYGDDLIMAVSDEYKDSFNTVTLQEWFRTYRIASTSADKLVETVLPYTTLNEATFLKRGFRKHPTRFGEWLAPLEWDSIEDIAQWNWSSPDARLSTRNNSEAALMECHGWGPEKFDEFKHRLNKALRKCKCATLTLVWDDIDSGFYDMLEY